MKKLILFIIFTLIFPAIFLNCNHTIGKKYISEQGMVWNTQFHITYSGAGSLMDSVRRILDDVGHSLSVFDSTSLVSIVNLSDSTPVNEDFVKVYEISKRVNRLSEGMFDPTLSPLITAWGFGPGHKISSDTTNLDSLLRVVGITKTHIRNGALIKDVSGISFNFSAVAKGYGCDKVMEMFRRNGVENCMVEIGGEIRASGKNPKGEKWSISIDRPIESDSQIIHDSQVIIGFTDMGIATSGNYRNYRKEGSQSFGHTISPISGRPIQTDVLSATVLAPTAAEADAYATAFMAMGSERSIKLAESLKLPAMLICDGAVLTTPEFDKLIISKF